MGTIADVVNFQMMKPLQGQTVAGLQPVGMMPDSTQGSPSSGQTTNINIQKPAAPSSNLPAPSSEGGGTYGPSVGTDATASDENLKTNIESGDTQIDALLNNLGAYQYEYKEPDKDGTGVFVSTMAQDLEKAGPIGKSVVINTPRGKMVDNGRLVATMLPALALHHQDIKSQSKTIDKLAKDMETLKKALHKAKRK